MQNNSYDLDHQTEPQKGIVQEVWRWKRAIEPTWHQGQPTQLASGETYLVSLRVKDVEGVWSDDNVKVLSTGTENMPPVAQFEEVPIQEIYEKYGFSPSYIRRVLHDQGLKPVNRGQFGKRETETRDHTH